VIGLVRARVPLVATAMASVAIGVGCTEVVTEYHRRPGFYKLASESELEGQYVAPDGTRVVFVEDGPLPSEQEARDARAAERAEAARRERERLRLEAWKTGRPIPPEAMEPEPAAAFQAREVADDGSVIYRAILPEHVIGNVMTCLRNQEYEALWNQVVCDATRRQWESDGGRYEDFVAWCVKNRAELMMMLNRMSFGYYGGSDVVVDRMPDASVRVRFSPQLATQFKFREVHVAMNRQGMGLAGIR
jgi:hypothetical protein